MIAHAPKEVAIRSWRIVNVDGRGRVGGKDLGRFLGDEANRDVGRCEHARQGRFGP